MSSHISDESKLPIHEIAPPQHNFILRPLRFSDISTLAAQNAEAYKGTSVDDFLYPRADLYPQDVVRNNRQTIWRRAVDVRILNLVACLASDPSKPIGYGQFIRLGDDEGAKRIARTSGAGTRLWFWVLSWVLWAYFGVENWLWPDRASSKEGFKLFGASNVADTERYWTSHPERKNRWHAQSIVVSPKWQGKGVGRMILSAALERAQAENTIMGLQASPVGEKLYRKMGFQMLGDYTYRVAGDDGGGIMLWSPEPKVEDAKSK